MEKAKRESERIVQKVYREEGVLKVTGVGLWSTSRGRGIGRSQLQREKRGVVSET